MTEETPLATVYGIQKTPVDPSEPDERFVTPSFNDLREAWYAHDDKADIVSDLSDDLFEDHDSARARANELGEAYTVLPLNAAIALAF